MKEQGEAHTQNNHLASQQRAKNATNSFLTTKMKEILASQHFNSSNDPICSIYRIRDCICVRIAEINFATVSCPLHDPPMADGSHPLFGHACTLLMDEDAEKNAKEASC